MNLLLEFLRAIADLRFRLLGRSIIQDIPTDQFNAIVKKHLDGGWKQTYIYEGFDAWIDYGRIDLRKGSTRLLCEWDNWTEGEISGPKAAIEEIARANGLTASERKKRWRKGGRR